MGASRTLLLAATVVAVAPLASGATGKPNIVYAHCVGPLPAAGWLAAVAAARPAGYRTTTPPRRACSARPLRSAGLPRSVPRWACLTHAPLRRGMLLRRACIRWFVTDDQDQMLGSSFPQHDDVCPMPQTKALMQDKGAMALNFFIHTVCPSQPPPLATRSRPLGAAAAAWPRERELPDCWVQSLTED